MERLELLIRIYGKIGCIWEAKLVRSGVVSSFYFYIFHSFGIIMRSHWIGRYYEIGLYLDTLAN